MNLNVNEWKVFFVKDIFDIKYGVNLELNACEESNDNDAVNFVSRTEDNNGVSAKVKEIDSVNVQKAGLITVAGGGSVLSTFVQPDDFYSGRDLYTLDVKVAVSEEVKHFLVTVIKLNKYKYNYGRQANKTLPFLELKLPIQHNSDGTPYIDPDNTYSEEGYVPDWQFMEDYMKSLHHKPLTTKKTVSLTFDVSTWKYFCIGRIMECDTTVLSIKDELLDGTRPFISRTACNNGCDGYVEVEDNALTKANCITIGAEGIYAFYQPDDFATGNKVYTLRNGEMNKYVGLFLCTILNKEDYRYSYGRARIISKLKEEIVKLPVQYNSDGTIFIDEKHKYSEEGYVPDWQFMEDYIKSLPYGDRL